MASQRPSQEGSVQVRFEGGEDLPILFANHVFLRGTQDGFLLSFAQSHGPYVANPNLEDLKRQGIAAKVICRLLIPHARMPEIVRIFEELAKAVEIQRIGGEGGKPSKERK